jgi:hypothetical protein
MGEVRIEFDGAVVEIRRARGRFVVTRAVGEGDLALDDEAVPPGGAVLSLDAPARVTFGAVTLAIDPAGSPRMRRLAARHDGWRVAMVLAAASSITLALLVACALMPRGRRFDLDVRPTIVARARLLPVVERVGATRVRSRAVVEPRRPARPALARATEPPPQAGPPGARRRSGPSLGRRAPTAVCEWRSGIEVPRVDLSELLGRSALGDAEEVFRGLGPVDDGAWRDVPAPSRGLFDGAGGGGRGEGTIGLGSVGFVGSLSSGRFDGRGPLAPTFARPRLAAGPRLDCLTEMPCPRIDRGPLDDAALLRRAVRQRRPALSSCYATVLARAPSLRGALVVRLVVDRTGRVGPVTVVESTLGDGGAEVTDCFARVLGAIQLPARAELVVATYPFSLRPEE